MLPRRVKAAFGPAAASCARKGASCSRPSDDLPGNQLRQYRRQN